MAPKSGDGPLKNSPMFEPDDVRTNFEPTHNASKKSSKTEGKKSIENIRTRLEYSKRPNSIVAIAQLSVTFFAMFLGL